MELPLCGDVGKEKSAPSGRSISCSNTLCIRTVHHKTRRGVSLGGVILR